MIITEFAQSRNQQAQTISIYINRHKEQFEGHTRKVGKSVELDDVALKILDEVYPLPKPVHIINGIPEEEHLKALALKDAEIQRLNKKMELMRDEYEKLLVQNGELKANNMLLEDREAQLKEKKEELAQEKQRNQELFASINSKNKAEEEADEWLQSVQKTIKETMKDVDREKAERERQEQEKAKESWLQKVFSNFGKGK